MRRIARALLIAAALVGRATATTATKAQDAPKAAREAALLEIRGEAPRPQPVSREAFAALRRRSVRARGHDGVESEYQGVALIDLLTKAGVATGPALKGQ